MIRGSLRSSNFRPQKPRPQRKNEEKTSHIKGMQNHVHQFQMHTITACTIVQAAV